MRYVLFHILVFCKGTFFLFTLTSIPTFWLYRCPIQKLIISDVKVFFLMAEYLDQYDMGKKTVNEDDWEFGEYE